MKSERASLRSLARVASDEFQVSLVALRSPAVPKLEERQEMSRASAVNGYALIWWMGEQPSKKINRRRASDRIPVSSPTSLQDSWVYVKVSKQLTSAHM